MQGRVEWDGEDGVLRSDEARWWIETRRVTERVLLAGIVETRNIDEAGPGWSSLFIPVEVENKRATPEALDDRRPFTEDEHPASARSVTQSSAVPQRRTERAEEETDSFGFDDSPF